MSDEKPTKPINPSSNKNGNGNKNSNIATLSSIKSDDNERDPGGQTFYAGGSEHSGQEIVGPQKPKRDSDKIVAEIFKQAREHAISEEELMNKKNKKQSMFSGVGATLGSSTETSKKVFTNPISISSSSNSSSDDSDDSGLNTTLKLWRDGFSIDDGPLRSYEDPKNKEFLDTIKSGKLPRELSRGGRAEIHVKMEDHRDEEYKPPPKKPSKPFTGEGQRLGAPASEIISAYSESIAVPDPVSREQALNDANAYLRFDNTQPHTRVQIRLADGSRLVPQINLDRPISDLRQYICIARPELAVTPFELMTTFPNKVVENESVTIKEGGLANASIVARIKKD